jgi:hypothetical protein
MKTEEGMMISVSEHEFNPVAVADPLETQILTPATAQHASDILTNGKIWY